MILQYIEFILINMARFIGQFYNEESEIMVSFLKLINAKTKIFAAFKIITFMYDLLKFINFVTAVFFDKYL